MSNICLKVLSLNLGLLIPSKTSQIRLDLFLSEINKDDYDIICLQEVWPTKFREIIKLRSGYNHFLDLDSKPKQIIKLFPSQLHIDSGLLILSKYPLKDKSRVKFSQNGFSSRFLDGEALVSKGAIGCSIDFNNSEIFIATTHLVSHYKTCSYRVQRRQQLSELFTWIDQQVATTKRKVIIMGDFNFSPPCPNGTKRFLETDKDWLEVKTYFQRYNHIDYHKITTSYPHRFNLKDEAEDRLNNKNKNKDEGCVDHIFTSQSLTIKNEQTIFKNSYLVSNTKKEQKIYISDHLALKADIFIN